MEKLIPLSDIYKCALLFVSVYIRSRDMYIKNKYK